MISWRPEIDRPKVLKEVRHCQPVQKLLFPFARAPAKCGRNGLSIHGHWGIRVRKMPKVCESPARLDRLVNVRWRSNGVEGQIEPEMKTAKHGTDEGRLQVNQIDCSAPAQTARDGNRKAFLLSILHFFCPPTPRWARAHKACPLSVDLSPCIRVRRAKSSRSFDQRSVWISDRSVVRSAPIAPKAL